MVEFYISKTFLRINVSPSNEMDTRTMRMIHKADCMETIIDTIRDNLAVVTYDEVLISIRRVDNILSRENHKVV